MLMHSLRKQFLLSLLLASLIALPAAPLFAAQEETESTGPEERLSEKLKSVLRGDIKSTSNYWLKNYGFLPAEPTEEEETTARINRTMMRIISAGRSKPVGPNFARQSLLESLQLINVQGKKSVLEGIGTTITHAGKNILFNLLAKEETDWNVIKSRQEFIKHLVENPDLLVEIQESLQTIKAHEFNFTVAMIKAKKLKDDESARNRMQNVKTREDLLGALVIILIEKLMKDFDAMRTGFYFSANSSALGLGVFGATTAALNTYDFLHRNNQLRETIFDATLGKIFGHLGRNAFGIKPRDIHYSVALFAILIGSSTALASYYGLKAFSKEFESWFEFAKSTAQTCRNVIKMHEDFCASEKLKGLYPTLFTAASPAWEGLLNRIEKSTFDEDKKSSLFFTHHGRVYNTIRWIAETENELGILLRFYGELDAYQAIAQFYLNHQTKTNNHNESIKCCFAEFVEGSTESMLHAQNFWHPIIEADLVRPSTLILGGAEKQPRDITVTGPNMGGKSVNLKAILINLILAQTFGIACAESFIFTPFKKIIARLESKDDTAGDKSKFMLEAIEMTNLLKEMMSLEPHEHAFVETDELFTGTEVGPAISLSIELCTQIASMKNVMYILATHYKELGELKRLTSEVFDNYKVNVTKNPETGKLIYSYSLSKGIGNTNVAFDIFLEQLEMQGIDNPVLVEVIKKAKARQEAIEAELEKNRAAAERIPMVAAAA